MKIKMIVACWDSNGSPDLYFCIVEIPEFCRYNNDGEHYDVAINAAKNDGYDVPQNNLTVCWDEWDAPKALLNLFDWKTASVHQPLK